MLGLVNSIYSIIMNRPLGITSLFYVLGRTIQELLKKPGDRLSVLQQLSYEYPYFLSISLFSLGVIGGSLFSALLLREFRVQRHLSISRFFLALLGGILMGYGAYIARGCNIGAMVGGIASFSLHGWVFALFLSIGVLVAGLILKRMI